MWEDSPIKYRVQVNGVRRLALSGVKGKKAIGISEKLLHKGVDDTVTASH